MFVDLALAPAISNMPASLTLPYGNYLQISPVITGTSPLTCEWRKDGVVLTGATNASYSKNGATAADAGSYTVTATNLAGTVTSSATTVTILPAQPPVVGSLGGPFVVNYGESLSLSPSVTGTTPITYQWKKDGVAIAGASSSAYSKTSVTAADVGSYTLTATNLAGAFTSGAVSVTVNPPVAPSVYGLPAVVALNYGDSLSFYPNVTGTQLRTFRWQKDGVDIPSATSSSFYKSGMTDADSGIYTLIVTNAWGSTTSAPVNVVVGGSVAPAFYNVPGTVTLDYGVYGTLSPTVTGTGPITYQWKKEGVVLAGATSASFNKSYVTTADSGQYTLTATNLAGTTTSPIITLTVRAAVPPAFTAQPLPVVAAPGRGATFTLAASGTSPLSYQWYGNGQAIAGARSASLVLTKLQPADFTSYYAIVTNPGGAAASATVALTPDSGLAVDAVCATTDRSFWLRSDHSLWGAGYNYGGQLGDGTTVNRANALQIATGVAAVSASGTHTLFLKLDGTLWAMGTNDSGQFANGTYQGSLVPVQVAVGVAQIAAGGACTYFIKTDGTLWSAGQNYYGQLGTGSFISRPTAQQVATGVAAVAAGYSHALFVKTDGTLWAMGQNYGGQLGDGTTDSRTTPWQVATQVVAATAGDSHSAFIKTDGTLWAMGSNSYGEIGNGTTVQQLTPVQVATNVAAVEAGNYDTFFLTLDHRLWAAGQNYAGQLGDGTTTSKSGPLEIAAAVEKISAGSGHSLFVKTDGTLWGMGSSVSGQLSDGAFTTTYLKPEQLTWRSAVAPVITAQPVSQTVAVGTDVTLSVSATGTLPLSYQWRKAGTELPGATAPIFHPGIAVLSLAGSYDVLVSNAGGSVASDAAVLAITQLAQTITFTAPADRAYTAVPFPLGANASSGLPVAFSILSGPATLSGNDVTLTGAGAVTVRASQAGDATYAAAADVDRSFTVAGNFASWTQGKFTAAELFDVNVSGPDAVLGHDGLPNLVKYALGLEPKQDITSGLPEVSTTATDWVYTYARPIDTTDVTYEVEMSTNLTTWTTAGVTHELVATGAGTETWRGRYPLASAANVFFRLKVTR